MAPRSTFPPRSRTPSADAIDAAMLSSVIFGALPRLTIAALAVGAATFGVLGMIAPRYQSEAQLTIDAKSGANPFADPRQASVPSDTMGPRMDKEAINTHIGALKSPSLAADIIARLELEGRPEFDSEAGDVDRLSAILRMAGLGGAKPGQTAQDRVLEAYTTNLQVFAARESRFISIRFTSVDPALAAAIPNAIAEAYRGQLASRQVDETKDVQEALEPKLAELVKEVAAADIAIERFRGKIDAFNAGQQKQSLNEQQLGELTNELSRAQAARSEAEARAASAREMLRAGSGEALPDVQRSPLIQNLVQQRVRVERQIAELNATLLPGHPRMLQLNADAAGLKKQIAAEVGKIVDGLVKEVRVAESREAAIQKRLAQIKVKVVDAGPDEAQLRALMADAKAKRDELERIQGQYNANKSRVESKAVPVEAKLVSPATAASVPVFPKKGPLSAMAAVATFILGLALTVLRGVAAGARSDLAGRADIRSAGLNKEDDVAVALPRGDGGWIADGPVGRPMAAAPSGQRPNQGANGFDAPDGLAIEGGLTIEGLVSHLARRTPERGGHRSLVVGETGAIDATSTAIALAKGLASDGHPVMLLEWSHGGSLLAPALSIPGRPGTAELVSGSAVFEDVISGIAGSDCHVITAGDKLGRSLAHQDPDFVNLVLDALDEAYAHIVVTGDHDALRQLFGLIEGRFDAGILVTQGGAVRSGRQTGSTGAGNETFLGYEVTEIEILLIPQQPRSKTAGRAARPRERISG